MNTTVYHSCIMTVTQGLSEMVVGGRGGGGESRIVYRLLNVNLHL